MNLNSAYELVTTRLGVLSIRDNVTNEIMHNPVGPWVEANSLYIDQSNLANKFLTGQSDLVIFDVGLGAAANALAVLHCARGIKNRRPLKLISFERDITLLQFALDHAERFEHFHGYEEAVRSILENGSWREDGIQWELRLGDYLEFIDNEPLNAEIIFFDPYSKNKNSEMWNVAAFTKTFKKCSGTLYTYSRATPVRVALLVSGFFVGIGKPTGPKEETTQASVAIESLERPLDQSWIGRWQRSHFPNAEGARPEDFEEVSRLVLNHPQFQL